MLSHSVLELIAGFVRDADLQEEIAHINPHAVPHMKEPSVGAQVIAVTAYPLLIQFLSNPCVEALHKVIPEFPQLLVTINGKVPDSVLIAALIKNRKTFLYIYEPSIPVQEFAVKSYWANIAAITCPSQSVQTIAIVQTPLAIHSIFGLTNETMVLHNKLWGNVIYI